MYSVFCSVAVQPNCGWPPVSGFTSGRPVLDKEGHGREPRSEQRNARRMRRLPTLSYAAAAAALARPFRPARPACMPACITATTASFSGWATTSAVPSSMHACRGYASQAGGSPVFAVFNRRAKWLQKERAAANVEASRQTDYLKDEVAFRLCERLLVRGPAIRIPPAATSRLSRLTANTLHVSQ